MDCNMLCRRLPRRRHGLHLAKGCKLKMRPSTLQLPPGRFHRTFAELSPPARLYTKADSSGPKLAKSASSGIICAVRCCPVLAAPHNMAAFDGACGVAPPGEVQ